MRQVLFGTRKVYARIFCRCARVRLCAGGITSTQSRSESAGDVQGPKMQKLAVLEAFLAKKRSKIAKNGLIFGFFGSSRTQTHGGRAWLYIWSAVAGHRFSCGGLTPRSSWIFRMSGIQPPGSKAASSRRTPKCREAAWKPTTNKN
jgi:hypothetical protein